MNTFARTIRNLKSSFTISGDEGLLSVLVKDRKKVRLWNSWGKVAEAMKRVFLVSVLR